MLHLNHNQYSKLSVYKILLCGNCLAKQILEKCNSMPKISYKSNNDYEKSADYIVSMIMIIILRRFYRLTFLKEEQRLYDHESSSLSLLLHQIFTLAKIFLPHMLLIKLRFPLCSLSIVKLLLALGICVISDCYIVLHPCTDYVLISCSRLPAASNI